MKKILFTFITTLAFILAPCITHAAITTPTTFYGNSVRWVVVCLQNSPGPLNQACNITPQVLVSIFLPNFIMLAGVILFFIILIAGWKVIGSAGQEASPQEKAKAQAALTYSLIGFLLVVSAYFILQIAGVITGIDFINPPI